VRSGSQSAGFGALESPDGRYLYYVRTPKGSAFGDLWRTNLAEGHDEDVRTGAPICYACFVVRKHGVYFVADDEHTGQRTLFLAKSGSGAISQITPLSDSLVCCIDMSPDERRIFYTIFEEKPSDLMLVENFR
jgi:hypothetical protein